MKRGTESIVRLGKSVEPADFSGINVLSTVILGKKESATKDFNGLFITDAVLLGKKISHSAVVTATVHGVSPLSLPDAVANTLSYVKAFGGTEQRNLPNGYTQVDYVTNTIKTAVNTGIMIDLTKNYEFEVECRATTGPWFILQSRESISLPNTGITGSGTGDTIILIVDGTAVCTSGITRTLGNRLYVKATLNNGVGTLYVKDITAGTEDTVTGNYSTSATNPTVPMYLLGNAAGQYVDTDSNVYMARIKENGVTIMDYVPAKQDTTAGFYDTVRGTFKTAGTPSGLSAGAVVSPSPDRPLDIVSNNGVLKVRVNLVNTANSTKGQYISSQGLIRPSANWATSDYLPVIAGGKVTVSGLTYASSAAGFNYYDASKNKVSTIPYETGTHTYTVPNNASYIMITYRWEEDESTVKVYVGETLNAPYADGTVETINAHGKNLTIVSQSSAGLGYVKIPSSLLNKTVTLSSNSTDFLLYAIGNSAYQPVWSSGTLIATFTVTQEMIDTVGLWVRKNSTYGAMTADELNSINLQLELGSTATEYEPYFNGGTATAEMLLKVGDNQDVQSILDGVVTRNIEVRVLDGTENWNMVLTAYADGTHRIYTNDFGWNQNTNGISTHFVEAPLADRDLPTGQQGKMYHSIQSFHLRATQFTSLEVAKQWLADQYAAGTPVTIIYPLAQAVTEQVAPQVLNVQTGDNVLEITQASLSGLELEAEYGKRAE